MPDTTAGPTEGDVGIVSNNIDDSRSRLDNPSPVSSNIGET